MNRFVKIAYNEALKSDMKGRYGAVLVHRKHVISRGHNMMRRGFKGTKWKALGGQEQCILRPQALFHTC